MKKKSILGILTATAAFSMLTAVGCSHEQPKESSETKDKSSWVVSSPDESLKAKIGFEETGALYYTVSKGDLTVVDRSTLGFSIAEDDLNMISYETESSRTILNTYQNITGKHSEVKNYCNETVITFKAWDFYFDVTMRVYDDGYAFRYGIRGVAGGEGNITVLEEKTQFAIPEKSSTWIQAYISNKPQAGEFFSYEEAYNYRSSSNLSNIDVSMPFLYRVGKSDVYSLVTESQLIGSGFYGSFLREAEENEGKGILQTEHSPARKADPDNVIGYPFESPWRVGITGSLKTVNESELVEKVYDDAEYWKPDNYDSLSAEEQEIYNYDWVDASPSSWNWLLGGHNAASYDYNSQRKYIELSQKMGWGYVLLDAAWEYNHTAAEITSLVDYAHERNVKVLVWCNSLPDFANGKKEALTVKLDLWKRYGVDGIKIDFFDGQSATGQTHQGEDIETIKWYETIYQETAKRKMVVNCHGANKPTGERRIYPNVINREAIRGNEFTNIDSTITVNQMFIRGVIGPSDFTPVVNPLSKGTTMAHQLALAVLYESGSPTMADKMSTYLNNAELSDLFKSIPALRDDTLFLCGELDEYYCAAVKSGEDWFIAGICSVAETGISLDLSFLKDYYKGYLYEDDGNGGIKKTVSDVDSETKQNITMKPNGGFVYHLVKKG